MFKEVSKTSESRMEIVIIAVNQIAIVLLEIIIIIKGYCLIKNTRLHIHHITMIQL